MLAPPLLLTFDLETDWGTPRTRGIDEALPRLVELLARVQAHATFFVVGELAERVRPHLSPDGPHEVGSHGLTHTILTRLDERGVHHELLESKRRLERLGYRVRGFRAPFLRRPPRLREQLAACGYDYDSSDGSVWPSWQNRAHQAAPSPVRELPPSTLRDGCTPFSLTWLRLLHPLGNVMISPRARVFYAHLHELIEGDGGWHALPWPLRRLHRRAAGTIAWRIVERLIQSRTRFATCSEFLAEAP